MTAGSAGPEEDTHSPDSPTSSAAIAEELPGAGPKPRLSLGDPLDGRAAEDRPESWGEHGESESDRLAHYRTETPPHHGG